MLKVYTTAHIEEAIRKKASKQGVPYSHYLAPFLEAIAEGRLQMVPHFPPPTQSEAKQAA